MCSGAEQGGWKQADSKWGHLLYTDDSMSQRFANIVPLAVPHATSPDITLQFYSIKEVWSSHHSLLHYPFLYLKKSTCFEIYRFQSTGKQFFLFSLLSCMTVNWRALSFSPSHFLDERKFIREMLSCVLCMYFANFYYIRQISVLWQKVFIKFYLHDVGPSSLLFTVIGQKCFFFIRLFTL